MHPDFEIRRLKIYNPFSNPADKDCLKKTLALTKYGAVAGLYVGIVDAAMHTKSKTMAGGLTRIGYHSSLLAVIGATYGSTLSIVGNIRNKDDEFNHFFAGLAAGSIMGVRLKSQLYGWGFGLFFGCITMMIKVGYIEGWKLYSNEMRRHNPYILNHYRTGFLTTRPDEEGEL